MNFEFTNNEVECDIIAKCDEYPVGSIFHGRNGLYILALVEMNQFSAISLVDGNRFHSLPQDSVKEAVAGLTFVADRVKITVSKI